MKYLQNLHTHSTFCDGKNTLEEMAQAAVEQGLDSVGFSAHSCMPFSKSPSLAKDRMEEYIAEASRVRDFYRGKLDIYTGLELEIMSPIDPADYHLDYVIGSCHYFHIGDEFVGFDRSSDEVNRVINVYFGGDGMAYAKSYYRMLAGIPDVAHIDIIGHFDLITKHAEKVCFFDQESQEYRNAVLEAMDTLIDRIPLLEINTGAIGRGYRTTPYPSSFILKEWRRRGGMITLSSDCHDVKYLTVGFADSLRLARECGYGELYYFDGKGFVSETID